LAEQDWTRTEKFHSPLISAEHLPLAVQTQRRALLNIANKLYKQGKRIQWKIVDTDYRLFADGELLLSNV